MVIGKLSSFRLRVSTTVLAALLLCVAQGCKYAGYHAYEMGNDSMKPTLSKGQRIIVDQRYYATHPLEDGDIIALHHNDSIIIKRVTALSGEWIEGTNGVLVRNGQTLSEPYVAPPGDNDVVAGTFPKRQVPQGQVFVTGDNRGFSLDSRLDEFGAVYVGDVIGKLAKTY